MWDTYSRRLGAMPSNGQAGLNDIWYWGKPAPTVVWSGEYDENASAEEAFELGEVDMEADPESERVALP